MNPLNNRLSKLKYDVIEHRLNSNPYDAVAKTEEDTLQFSIRHALWNIGKLRECCTSFDQDIHSKITNLQQQTEALLTLVLFHQDLNALPSPAAEPQSPPNRTPTSTPAIPWISDKSRSRIRK